MPAPAGLGLIDERRVHQGSDKQEHHHEQHLLTTRAQRVEQHLQQEHTSELRRASGVVQAEQDLK